MEALNPIGDAEPAVERIVLIGANITHSRSPRLHTTLFQRYRLPYRYHLMPLEAGEVLSALDMMKRGGFRGANVTSPHKQVVMMGLDDCSDAARAIGAVNTIVFERGRAMGDNTDVDGFRRSLLDVMPVAAPFSAAVLGTGGAALAAIHVLAGMEFLGALTIYSRVKQRAARIAARWSDDRIRGDYLDNFHPADLVVHATPVGLAGDPRALLDSSRLRGSGLLFEMIYSPAETPLMLNARAAGMRAVGGRGMFIGQALRSFALWTGVEAGVGDVPEGLFGER